MSEEPRRSGRATKGQHKKASPSPAPAAKPNKTARSKPAKKANEPEVNDEDEEEVIRCICGNKNPKDKRAFIGCDACEVWQHNVCMGVTDDEDEVPDHYFCEQCEPAEHQETLQALDRGEKIWETRNKIYQNEKRMSKNRKNKGDDAPPGWLRKDPSPPQTETDAPPSGQDGAQDAGNKRKREEVKLEQGDSTDPDQKSTRSGRQDKRRKSSTVETSVPPEPEARLVDIAELPPDRQKVAQTLARILSDDIQQRVKSGFQLPEGQSGKSLGEYHAVRVEHALFVNHGVPKETAYATQFRALNANLKKNSALIERLLNGSLVADELATMSTGDMASDELVRERAAMKEVLDRQVVAIPEEGPRYRQDHKGFTLIEDETSHLHNAPVPHRHPAAEKDGDGNGPQATESPTGAHQRTLSVDTSRPAESELERRTSSQQFDMSNIWAKTAQSPGATSPQSGQRTAQAHARRPSSVQPRKEQPNGGAMEDPDVDRMLEDNDEPYSPAQASGQDAIIWRGKLMQSNEELAPTVNARFVAGRDLSTTLPWQQLLPHMLSIDGRLQTQKAEDYLCGLRWSSSSDVSVLSLTPYDNAEAFNNVFNYFQSRQRYAVVEKNKPAMVKDLYIIPVDVGAKLPDHIEMLEYCTLKKPVEERLLLATFVIARAPESRPTGQQADATQLPPGNPNDNLPHHMRSSISGPAGSPINPQNPTFSPLNAGGQAPPAGYGGPSAYPVPYSTQRSPPYPAPQPHPNPKVNEILGELQYAPTAQQILQADPNLAADKLGNLKQILVEDVDARTNFEALTARLFSSR